MNNSRLAAGLAAMLAVATLSLAADDAITLPAGSELQVELVTTLSTKSNDTGDLWVGKVVEPVFGKGGEIVPEGSTVDGHITYVKGPGRVKGKGEMCLIADSISTPDSSKYNILTFPETAQGAKGRDQERAVQESGKDMKGTTVEVGICGGVGTQVSAIAPHKKGKDVVLSQGTEITFLVSRNTTAKKVPVASSN